MNWGEWGSVYLGLTDFSLQQFNAVVTLLADSSAQVKISSTSWKKLMEQKRKNMAVNRHVIGQSNITWQWNTLYHWQIKGEPFEPFMTMTWLAENLAIDSNQLLDGTVAGLDSGPSYGVHELGRNISKTPEGDIVARQLTGEASPALQGPCLHFVNKDRI